MKTTLLTTTIRGINSDRPVVVTEGALLPNGRRVYGVFATEDDARMQSADSLAIASLGENQLSLEQIKIAEINSDNL